MELNNAVMAAHQAAVDNGWWDGSDRSFGELIALMHSELSEALEAERNGEPSVWYDPDKGSKPEGAAIELIDTVIRIFDLLGKWETEGNLPDSVESLLLQKLDFNASRGYRHGNKRF